MLKGTTITYLKKTKTGIDDFGVDTFSTTRESVKNVLVAPVEDNIEAEMNDLSKRRERLVLGIPKGDTHVWECCTIEYKGKTYRSIGIPVEGIEELVPTKWHKKVTVERYG